MYSVTESISNFHRICYRFLSADLNDEGEGELLLHLFFISLSTSQVVEVYALFRLVLPQKFRPTLSTNKKARTQSCAFSIYRAFVFTTLHFDSLV